MPKAQPLTFYNHGARPAAARQLQASTTTAGHTILSYISTNVFVNPPAQVGHTHPEFYTVDFDDASAQVDTTMEDSTNVMRMPPLSSRAPALQLYLEQKGIITQFVLCVVHNFMNSSIDLSVGRASRNMGEVL